MTDKVQKIKEWISKTQDGLMDANGNFEYPEHEGAYHILCNLDTYIDYMQEEPKECMYSKDHYTDEDRKVLCDGCEEECKYAQKEEPVSEDLEKMSYHSAMDLINNPKFLPTTTFGELIPMLQKLYKDGAQWQKEKEYTCYEEAFEDGAKWKVENLWKPADGDDLPEYEREVVVFTQNFPDDAGMMRVAIGHRPNPDGWDGKSLSTGKVEHYTPKTYDKGGWNVPDVKYWLDVELPKEI